MFDTKFILAVAYTSGLPMHCRVDIVHFFHIRSSMARADHESWLPTTVPDDQHREEDHGLDDQVENWTTINLDVAGIRWDAVSVA